MNIVLVEDDRLSRLRLQALLASCLPQARLDVFDRLKTALAHAKAKVQAQATSNDYWLIDLGLPDGSGIDLIRAVRKLQPLAHILVISVFGDVERVVNSIQAGANGYLLKDTDQQDLVGALEAMEVGGTPLSPLIASRLLETLVFSPPKAPVALALSPKEAELLSLLSRGYTYLEAALALAVAPSTIQTHIKRIYSKLAVNSSAEAVFEAKALGMIH